MRGVGPAGREVGVIAAGAGRRWLRRLLANTRAARLPFHAGDSERVPRAAIGRIRRTALRIGERGARIGVGRRGRGHATIARRARGIRRAGWAGARRHRRRGAAARVAAGGGACPNAPDADGPGAARAVARLAALAGCAGRAGAGARALAASGSPAAAAASAAGAVTRLAALPRRAGRTSARARAASAAA